MNQKTNNHCSGKPCVGKSTCTGKEPHTGKEPCAGREHCAGEKPCAGNRLDDAAGKLHTIIETRIEKHLRKTSRTNIISEDISYTNSSCRKQICTKTFTKEFSCCMEVN